MSEKSLFVCLDCHNFFSGEQEKSDCRKCPQCGGDVVIRKTKKGRKYYGCEGNPDCDFMSWQKPSDKKCPVCDNYMVEKGNRLVCSEATCGHVEQKEK